jgi:hypothetical protein
LRRILQQPQHLQDVEVACQTDSTVGQSRAKKTQETGDTLMIDTQLIANPQAEPNVTNHIEALVL